MEAMDHCIIIEGTSAISMVTVVSAVIVISLSHLFLLTAASKLLFNRPTGVGAKYTCLIPRPYPIPGNEASCVLTKE